MNKPVVGLVMGSKNDWQVMKLAAECLNSFAIPYEKEIVSAHRTPTRMYKYAKSAKGRGLKCIIAGAGGAAHLPGMLASLTLLPVLGVPIAGGEMQGMDALCSIAQMPKGVPVATFAVGPAGAENAALFACALLAMRSQVLYQKLATYRESMADAVLNSKLAD